MALLERREPPRSVATLAGGSARPGRGALARGLGFWGGLRAVAMARAPASTAWPGSCPAIRPCKPGDSRVRPTIGCVWTLRTSPARPGRRGRRRHRPGAAALAAHGGIRGTHRRRRAAALEGAHAFVPDLVVLDLGLPGIDGIDVAKRLRQADDDVPILILTARDAVESRVEGLDRAPTTTWSSRSSARNCWRGCGRCCAAARPGARRTCGRRPQAQPRHP